MNLDFSWLSLPWVVSSFTLLAAVAVEQLIQWPKHKHPMGFMYLIAQRIGETLSQQKRALSSWLGLLLWSLLIIPILAIVAFVVSIAEYRAWLEGVILLQCIPTFSNKDTTARVYRYLLKDKKQLARDTLQPWVLRETSPLSALGVAKACSEMRLLRYLYQLATPLMLYALGGVYWALAYRLTYECMQAWNPKLKPFAEFGLGLRWLSQVAQWPAAFTFVLLLGLSAPQTVFNALREIRYHSPGAWFLAAVGARMNCQFCGPAQYKGEIHRTARVGSETSIKLDHLKLLTPLLFEANFLFIIICIGIASI